MRVQVSRSMSRLLHNPLSHTFVNCYFSRSARTTPQRMDNPGIPYSTPRTQQAVAVSRFIHALYLSSPRCLRRAPKLSISMTTSYAHLPRAIVRRTSVIAHQEDRMLYKMSVCWINATLGVISMSIVVYTQHTPPLHEKLEEGSLRVRLVKMDDRDRQLTESW